MRSPVGSSSTGHRERAPTGRLMVWACRLVWLAFAVFGGAAFGEAVHGASRAVQLTTTIGAWAVWAVGALALAVPSTASLTILRTMTPAALVAAVAAAFSATETVDVVVCIGLAAVMCAVVAGAELGEVFAQASAYGDERRFPLRPPVAMVPPLIASWCLWCAAAIAGPLLVADGSWPLGVPLSLVALGAGWYLGRRYHRFTRRWLVLVPAGVVIHDHLVLAESAMFPRPAIIAMHLAFSDTGAADLTGPAAGNAVEIEFATPATVVLDGGRHAPRGRAIHASAVLVAPSRPGRALSAAAERRLPVG